ncbi:MAG: hypothetical protein JOY96_06690 [Verrucomicrobia bacterium]|nr:hypothetical protein [Verrucomicrobiota bacterium]MBV9673415.1 hypothetical protein [Verrucomicrobiota bacterium]
MANYLAGVFFAAGFLAADDAAGEAGFFATFLAGAFFSVVFLDVVVFLAGAAGLAGAGFFAAGIHYPPLHSAVAEDKT